MSEIPTDNPKQNLCGAKTADGTPCQRRVKSGTGPCMYHASTFNQKLKAWARNHTLGFILTIIGLLVGSVSLFGWAYDEFVRKPPPSIPSGRAGFLQLEDYWFRPQKLVPDDLTVSLWLRNDGATPVEGEVHYFEVRIVPVERDILNQEQEVHKEFVSNALKFNADQIQKGFSGRAIGKGQGVWQTMTFPHLPQERIDGILQG
jgi:hypothetical protein